MRGTSTNPLFRSSYALLLTTGLNAVLGMAFWVTAARLFPPDVVGLGAGGISALQLAATIGWVGLQFTLLRYAPTAGRQRRRLVVGVYGAGAAAGLAGAAVFVTFLAPALRVGYLSSSSGARAVFVLAVGAWVVFSLQDAALLGIRRAAAVPVENFVYGALKLVLIVALGTVDDPWTLLGVWSGTAALLAVVVNVLLLKRWLAPGRADQAGNLPALGALARFSAGHTAVALTSWAPDFLIPLLVLRYLGEDANAYYYAAWTIGFSARLLLLNVANALTVEAAYAEDTVRRLLASARRLAVVVLVPSVLVLLLGAPLLLQVFGEPYRAAVGLLRWYALSLPLFAIATFVAALDRVRERFELALAITASSSAVVITLDVLLLPRLGLSGAGLSWLLAQVLSAAVAVVGIRSSGGLVGVELSELDGELPAV